MAKKDEFIPEETFEMVPIEEGSLEYGYEITKLYDNSMNSVMQTLFCRGITGMTCDEPEPKNADFIHTILASQMFSRPEDQTSKVNPPELSSGFHVSAKYIPRYYGSLRWYRAIRFTGELETLLEADWPEEGTGTMAVALAGNMALNGITPGKKRDGIIVREIKIASMHADDDHKEPWLAVEFDVYVHTSFFSPIGFPRDAKTGYVPLDALRKLSEGREG